MRASILLGLVACGGPDQQTLIDELRVVAAVSEPASVGLGEPYTLTVTVADPLGEGSEVLLWSCLPITGSAGLAPDLRGALPPGVEPGCVRHHQVPVDEQVVVQGVAVAPLPVWMLACAPGLCGDLQGVDDAQLEDPLDWLTELPISGVSAASRAAPLHMEGEEPALNPPIEESPPSVVEGATGQVIPLSFLAPGAQIAFGYTTAGGFSMPSYDVSSEGRVALSWVAPEEPGAARLYVVVEDGRGGSTLWRGDAAIR